MHIVHIGPQDGLPDLEPCYDSLIKHFCSQHPNVHWCLIKAQIRQESLFSPVAISDTGPVGLGQFTWRTWDARRPGKDRRDIFEMVGAMVEEMNDLLRWAWSHGAHDLDAWRFALGAYNAGQGNLVKCQQIVAAQNVDPAQWGNMPHALLQVVGPNKTEEVTSYVARIMEWAETYMRIAEDFVA